MGFEIFVIRYNSILCDIKSLLVIEISEHCFFCLTICFVFSHLSFPHLMWFHVFCVLDLDSCVLLFANKEVVWMWCTYHGISMLCVMSAVTTMVISVDVRAHDKRFKTFCDCCLLFTRMLLFLQTSNFMSTFLLMPSTGNYHPMIKGISYFKNYHTKWKCIEEAKNEYMNTTKLYVILI
jgi:hypothetical protein